MKILLSVAVVIICVEGKAQVSVTSGAPTRLPRDLVEYSSQYRIESSQQTSGMLVRTNTDYYVQVGQLKSTKINNRVENPTIIRERIQGLDFAGGLWNSIFNGGGEFSTSHQHMKGLTNAFSDFGMKRKKELVGSVTSVVKYSYGGDVRRRSTPASSSQVVSNLLDTLAVIGQITTTLDQTSWHLELLVIRGENDIVSGTITHGSDVYQIYSCQECAPTTRGFTFHKGAQIVAGVELAMLSSVYILNSLSENDKAALSCSAAILKNSFDLAYSAH